MSRLGYFTKLEGAFFQFCRISHNAQQLQNRQKVLKKSEVGAAQMFANKS